MRTKNFNLKKKIAFISSVAMIATTAAYLPAGSLTANAAVPTVAQTYVKTSDKTELDAANGTVQTINVFVKIDNKYLTVYKADDATTDVKKYKLKNTLEYTPSDGYYPVELSDLFVKNAADPFHDAAWINTKNDGKQETTEADYLDSTNSKFYDVLTTNAIIDLPYFANANTVTLEFAAKAKASLTTRSLKSVDIELNEHGVGKLGNQTEYVTGKSLTSTYDEIKEDFKKTANGGWQAAAGSYEVLDLSGLEVCMGNKNRADDTAASSAIDFSTISGGSQAVVSVDNKATTAEVKLGFNTKGTTGYFAGGKYIDADDYKSDSFDIVKVGSVYARVITGTLTEALEPNQSVKLETGAYAAWTASGAGVSDGKVTVSMDENGYGVSNLVTMTKDGEKEYYVYIIKNPDNNLFTAGAANNLIDQFTFEDNNNNKNIFGDGADHQLFADGLDDTHVVNAADRYKVEAEVKSEKVGKGKQYVTKYTIYNNETKDEYNALRDAVGDNEKWVKINFTSSSVALDEDDFVYIADTTISGIDADRTKLDGKDGSVWTDATKWDEVSDTRIGGYTKADGTNAGSVEIYIKRSDAGTAESEVLALRHYVAAVPGGAAAHYETEYVQFIFTNQYEIKCDNQDLNNREDLTVDYDSKVVVNGQKVNNPGAVDKKGFEFKGWNTASDGKGTNIFTTDNGTEQMNESNVTPNIKLYAQYRGYRYDVKLDGNGGYIAEGSIDGGAGSDFAFFPGESTKQPSKASFTSIQRTIADPLATPAVAADADILKFKKTQAVKAGAEFLGWSTDKDATKPMLVDDIADAFPGENKTLTLYAVYNEKKEISAEFKMFDVVAATGEQLDSDGKVSKVGDNWTGAVAATFEKSSDAAVTFTTGEKLGKLPTPYLKGYKFEGWYIKTFNTGRTSVMAQEVTADTVLDSTFFEDFADQNYNVTNTTVYLYAKFSQINYNITFDIGDGLWASAEVTKKDGRLPATMSYNAKTEEFGFRRPNNTVVNVDDDLVANPPIYGWTTVENPTVGSGEMTGFKCWRINGSKQSYSDLKQVYNGLKKLTTLGDVTITAEYEDKENTVASKIFMNANEGAFYRYRLNEVDPTTKKPTAFYEADVDNATTDQVSNVIEDYQQSGLDLIKGTAGVKVNSKWIIKGDTIETTDSGASAPGYVVARPGYDFTGWYTDKECTEPYTFDVYPDKGTEIILFAGWKKSTSVRYWVDFNLFNADKSEITMAGNTDLDEDGTLTFRKTYMGTIGENADASKIKIMVKDGTGTQATYKNYVYDPVLSKSVEADKTGEIECEYQVGRAGANATGLKAGKLEQKQPYTIVKGRFVEEGYQNEDPENPPVSKELGTATDVKVAADGTVTFKAAANAKKYQVAKIVGSKTYYSAKTEDTTIKITPTKSDYKVYVIAFNEDGTQSTHSVIVSGKGTGSQVALGTVMDPVATEKIEADGTKTVTISWSKATNAAWYKVFKIVNGKKYWGSKVTDTSYVLKNIPATDSYIVYVAAGDGKGHVTYGARKKVSKFPSVTNVTLAPDNKTVTFDAAKGAVAYQVAKIETNNKVNYSAKSTNPSITLKNAFKAGQKYYVLAFFTDEDGKTKSSYSDTFEVK